MAAGTLMATALGFFASSLIDEFGVSRGTFGLLVTASIIFGAFVSPSWGRIADRFGGRWTMVAVFAMAAAGFVAMAAAPVFALLFVGAVITSFSMAASNPATNKLITLHVAPGRRGTVTGIKQSGVQAASFLSGLAIPVGASTIGWRMSMVVIAALIFLFVPLSLRLLPPDVPDGEVRRESAGDPLPGSVKWLTGYGFLIGFAGSSGFLVPLFAEEEIGFSLALAGLVGAILGLSAFTGRILWARWAEPKLAYGEALAIIAAISMLASIVMLAASPGLPLLVWVGAVLLGIGTQSWNAPGMLAVMADAGPKHAGRASGAVQLGFLGGLGIAPPIYGLTADVSTGQQASYNTMWLLALVASAAALVLTLAWLRSSDKITSTAG